ncbi:MAG: undecaprenyl-diphosphate phosphatase [Acidobacteriota bacterium]|nr:undecaprenyl-diphosphate phosphatase [Acidobacteriota bacterium]
MNDYLLSVILGIVEGLTEFLPVSSTAHLRISEALLGVSLEDGYWKMFSIVIQLGAILCLPIFFRARIAEFLATFPHGRRGNRTPWNHPLTLVMTAFVCTAGPSFLLKKVIGKNLENLLLMGTALIVGGLVMWAVDSMYGDRGGAVEELEQMSVGQAVWVGLCQNLSAIFPGTSRSMATIAAGQIAGFSRAAALEFSFLLSIPTMIAATGYDFLKYLKSSPARVDSHQWVVLAIGFVVSFLVAYVVVAWFMNWVRRRGFVPFAIYRLIAGAAVLAWALKSGH